MATKKLTWEIRKAYENAAFCYKSGGCSACKAAIKRVLAGGRL